MVQGRHTFGLAGSMVSQISYFWFKMWLMCLRHGVAHRNVFSNIRLMCELIFEKKKKTSGIHL